MKNNKVNKIIFWQLTLGNNTRDRGQTMFFFITTIAAFEAIPV